MRSKTPQIRFMLMAPPYARRLARHCSFADNSQDPYRYTTDIEPTHEGKIIPSCRKPAQSTACSITRSVAGGLGNREQESPLVDVSTQAAQSA